MLEMFGESISRYDHDDTTDWIVLTTVSLFAVQCGTVAFRGETVIEVQVSPGSIVNEITVRSGLGGGWEQNEVVWKVAHYDGQSHILSTGVMRQVDRWAGGIARAVALWRFLAAHNVGRDRCGKGGKWTYRVRRQR
jgi:hypothetical protein